MPILLLITAWIFLQVLLLDYLKNNILKAKMHFWPPSFTNLRFWPPKFKNSTFAPLSFTPLQNHGPHDFDSVKADVDIFFI